jgi:hypothetical protein
MQSVITIYSALFFVLLSCASPTTPSDENNDGKIETINLPTTYFDYNNTALTKDYQRTSKAHFSSENTHDEMTLYISKGPISQTRVTIRVHNAKKELIYEHVFPTTQLIYGYDLDEIHSEEQMEAKIIEWANHIVDNGFTDPNQLPDDHYLNRAHQDEFMNYDVLKKIKTSKRMILYYILGEENHMYLGYSDEDEVAVQLIFCC